MSDGSAAELRKACQRDDGALIYAIRSEPRESLDNLSVIADVSFSPYRIKQYENGTVVIEKGGKPAGPARPILRTIAAEIGVSRLNSAGNPRNTRQLGAEVIDALNQKANNSRER